MSVTYYARGRNLIVDSGHTGYEVTGYRAYLRSPQAQNVLVMPGVRFSAATATYLTRRSIRPDGQFFEFTDTAYGGNTRGRSIYISQRPDLMLVFDRASGASRYQQLWHLDPGLKITSAGRSYVTATAPGTELQIRQIPLPGQSIPRGSTRVTRGQNNPYQGWVSRSMLQRTPARDQHDAGRRQRRGSLSAPGATSSEAEPGVWRTRWDDEDAPVTVTGAGGGAWRKPRPAGARYACWAMLTST